MSIAFQGRRVRRQRKDSPPPRPRSPDELLEELRPREPITELKEALIELDLTIGVLGEAEIQLEQNAFEGAYLRTDRPKVATYPTPHF